MTGFPNMEWWAWALFGAFLYWCAYPLIRVRLKRRRERLQRERRERLANARQTWERMRRQALTPPPSPPPILLSRDQAVLAFARHNGLASLPDDFRYEVELDYLNQLYRLAVWANGTRPADGIHYTVGVDQFESFLREQNIRLDSGGSSIEASIIVDGSISAAHIQVGTIIADRISATPTATRADPIQEGPVHVDTRGRPRRVK